MKSEIANAVLERANGYCESCGLPGDNFALHHRKLRSQGGKDAVSNLIAVHHECHNLATHSIHLNINHAVAHGFIVPSWADPSEFPLHMADGSIVRLDEYGSYITMEEGKDGNDRGNW